MKPKMKGIVASVLLALGSQAHAATQIEWLQWFAAEQNADFYDAIVEEFEAENPDIKVKLVTQPFGKVRESIVTNRAIGVGSDVLGLNMPWTSEFLDMNILEPLDDYLARDDNDFEVERLVQAPIGKIDGSTWMVPLNAFPFVMHVNRGLLQRAGFDKAPGNWEELMSMATAISALEEGLSGLGMPFSSQPPANGPILTFLPLLYTAGGRIVDGTSPDFDNPEVVKTLTFLQELNDSGALAPGAASRTGGVDLEEFIAGRTGFLISPAVHARAIVARNPKLDYELVRVPVLSTEAYRVHGWELGLAADSRHKEEAWKFISFLMSTDVNGRMAAAASALPGNLDALGEDTGEDPIFTAQRSILEDDESVEELRQAPKTVASWSVMTEEMQSMLAGNQTPQETASRVQARWLELLK
ncbi:ABC transporter substrate-binding protein [Granulosicoccus sp. 3-233]|uniref:ABC transporter substrate-binding protein n=1 Tax=Granulosicoccus sp. 3-233 TaxID=3417969 RepID=UPI003D330BEA